MRRGNVWYVYFFPWDFDICVPIPFLGVGMLYTFVVYFSLICGGL